MKLKDSQIKALKPSDKDIKLSDGASLFLLVRPSGKKTWVYLYRFEGKQKKLTIGTYPDISLSKARIECQNAKELLKQGIDPTKQKKLAMLSSSNYKFSTIAKDWFSSYMTNKSSKTKRIYERMLNDYILPYVGHIDIRDIKRIQLVNLVKENTLSAPIEDRSKRHNIKTITSALKVSHCLGMVFNYAMNSGIIEYSIAANLSSVLPKYDPKNLSTLLKKEDVRVLIRAIRTPNYASKSVWYFLNIMPYVFVRNSELRCATWDEFDLEKMEWYIKGERMKGKKQDQFKRQPHFVPLSRQVVTLLKELKEGSKSDFLFPAQYNQTKCITDAAPLVALKRFEFNQTVHGFRTIASTYLHELNFSTQIIEAQLAHKDTNEVRATYNKAEYKEERIKMMQIWADYLDELAS